MNGRRKCEKVISEDSFTRALSLSPPCSGLPVHYLEKRGTVSITINGPKLLQSNLLRVSWAHGLVGNKLNMERLKSQRDGHMVRCVMHYSIGVNLNWLAKESPSKDSYQ